MLTFVDILEAVVLASSLSMDAFVASFAYGSNKIKIPMASVQVINIVCSGILGISILIGSFVRPYLPEWLAVAICFTILFVLGAVKLLDSVTKSIIRKHTRLNKELNKEIKFSMFNFKFILNLYADPEEADVDASKLISPAEAAALAVSLSLDGMAVGFGAAVGNVNGLAVVLASLAAGTPAVMLGSYIGNKIAGKLPFNLSWLSGIILIALAFLKLF